MIVNNVLENEGMRRVVSIVIGCLVGLASVATAEDLTVVSSVKVGKKQYASLQVVTDEKVRAADAQTETIFDVATGDMIFIDHKKEEFFETSFDEMQAKFEEIDRSLEGNPMLRRMLAGKQQEVVLEKGSESKTIAGYDCQHYILSMGKGLRMELWSAPDLEVPATYFDARKLSYAAMGPVGKRFNQMIEEMQKIEGFPLASHVFVKMMGMKSESMTEATAVTLGPVDDDAFAVPAGYKQGKSPYQN